MRFVRYDRNQSNILKGFKIGFSGGKKSEIGANMSNLMCLFQQENAFVSDTLSCHF